MVLLTRSETVQGTQNLFGFFCLEMALIWAYIYFWNVGGGAAASWESNALADSKG